MSEHKWSNCGLCGPMVVCGKCGNNCCNGGYGMVDGKTCDECPDAYDLQDKGPPDDFGQKLLARKGRAP